MSGAQQRGERPLAADNLTESVSTDDSVEGIARELAGMRNVVEENIPNDTDQYVYRADPLKLMELWRERFGGVCGTRCWRGASWT